MITYTYDWSASDDGSVFGGGDLQNIQTDISGQAVDLISVQTISGVKTFSGNIVISGDPTISGDVTFSGAVNLPATGVVIGAANQGDIFYDDGTDLARLTPGTSGQYLKSQGAGANPAWASLVVSQYFEPDGTCFLAFDNGSVGADLSPLNNVISLTSLDDSDLVDGKVGRKCYDYAGGDFVDIAHHAAQAGMAALTIEAVVYRDTASAGNNYIFLNLTDDYIHLIMTNTNITWKIVTAAGTETGSQAHGLSDNGINQWAHIAVTWDSASASIGYVNGASIGNGDHAGNGIVSDSANGIRIGAVAAANGEFPGIIDGVRLLRRKMGAAEILLRYNTFVA